MLIKQISNPKSVFMRIIHWIYEVIKSNDFSNASAIWDDDSVSSMLNPFDRRFNDCVKIQWMSPTFHIHFKFTNRFHFFIYTIIKVFTLKINKVGTLKIIKTKSVVRILWYIQNCNILTASYEENTKANSHEIWQPKHQSPS